MNRDPEIIASRDHLLAEGPLWHPDERHLYWVDIVTGRIFRYDPSTEADERVLSLDQLIGGYTFQADGTLLCFMERGQVGIWNGTDLEIVIDSIPEEVDTRFNDVIADPEGRVFGGTMPTEDRDGRLYRIDTDGSYQVVDENGYAIPNGMGFTPGLDGLYVTESERRTVYRFDYDRESGKLSNRRPVIEVPESTDAGLPDGLTVDAEGNIWSARWDGACVVCHDENGEAIDSIDFPAPKVSSIAFGGREFTQLYATTARGHDGEDDPPAGSIFRVATDVSGVPEFRSRVGLD